MEHCLELLVNADSAQSTRLFHGAPRCFESLLSTLDLWAKKTQSNVPYKAEHDSLKAFARDAWPHLDTAARSVIDDARSKWQSTVNTGTMFVARHFGLPTRCVDWTWNAQIGLFFACRRSFDEDGVVWWMDNRQLEEAVKSQWPSVFNVDGNVEDHIERAILDSQETEWIACLHYPPRLSRATAQEACVSISGRIGVAHDQLMTRIGVTNCGRVRVPSALKRQVLQYLQDVGVTGSALGLQFASIEDIARDIRTGLSRP